MVGQEIVKKPKINTDIAIARSKALYGDSLDYSKTVYTKSGLLMTFICKIHGEFRQTLSNHCVCACSKCKKILTNAKNSLDTLKFTEKALLKHGDLYDYSLVDYTGIYNKVKIICRKHGVFEQEATIHLKGSGCMQCRLDKHTERFSSNSEEFVEKCSYLPQRGYDYSLVDYKGSGKAVEIVCPTHGSFFQTPSSHLKGHGCKACSKSGYDPSKSGYLYILRCEDITKVGITNLSAKERCRSVSKSYGKKFEVLLFIKFCNGVIPDRVETLLLRELRQQYAPPLVKFEGSSEAFIGVDYEALLRRAVHFIGEVSDNINH